MSHAVPESILTVCLLKLIAAAPAAAAGGQHPHCFVICFGHGIPKRYRGCTTLAQLHNADDTELSTHVSDMIVYPDILQPCNSHSGSHSI